MITITITRLRPVAAPSRLPPRLPPSWHPLPAPMRHAGLLSPARAAAAAARVASPLPSDSPLALSRRTVGPARRRPTCAACGGWSGCPGLACDGRGRVWGIWCFGVLGLDFEDLEL